MRSLLDRLYASLANRRPFFGEGWGDLDRLQALCQNDSPQEAPGRIDVRLQPLGRKGGATLLSGVFASPYRDLPLPPESRQAHVEFLLPPGASRRTPVCLHFAATGDEGFGRRRQCFALPLAQRGIASLILENPYYGRRRPAGQEGKTLRRFTDLWAMAGAAVAEGRSLLQWLRREGYHRLGVCGISMGGSMAAQVAVLEQEAVAVIGGVTAHSASAVFTEGILSRYLAWKVLDRAWAGEGTAIGLMRTFLDRTDLRRFPPPRRPEAARLVAARDDAYIPSASARMLHDHWQGSSLTWLETGHVGAVLFHRRAFLSAVLEAFARL